MNRAFDGDSVAVEILPESEWERPSSRLPDQNKAEVDDVHAVATAHVAEVHLQPIMFCFFPCFVDNFLATGWYTSDVLSMPYPSLQ
jgi:hypothetical protein